MEKAEICTMNMEEIEKMHKKNHFGMDKKLYLAKLFEVGVDK